MKHKQFKQKKPSEVLEELKNIAKELGLPLSDENVLKEWYKRGNVWSSDVYIKIIYPLYVK